MDSPVGTGFSFLSSAMSNPIGAVFQVFSVMAQNFADAKDTEFASLQIDKAYANRGHDDLNAERTISNNVLNNHIKVRGEFQVIVIIVVLIVVFIATYGITKLAKAK